MHLKLRFWLVIGLAVWGMHVHAQSAQFSQYYALPLYLNPAFTGATYFARANLSHRSQWPTNNARISSYQGSYDRYFHEYKFGLGGIATHSFGAEGLFSSTQINFSSSYALDLGNGQSLRFGLQPGILHRSSRIGNFTFGDQLQNNRPSEDPTSLQTSDRKTNFDLGSGILLTEKNYWIGLSTHHLNRPNLSFTNTRSSLPIKWSFHGGYKLGWDDTKGLVNKLERSLTLTGLLKHQGISTQLDAGAYIHLDPVIFGLWYRGIPIIKSQEGFLNQDALVAMVGFKNADWHIGYSFDYTLSVLSGRLGNAHEITLQFEFGERNIRKKTFKKLPTMYMPYPKI